MASGPRHPRTCRPRRHRAGSESRHLIGPDELERRLRERLDALGPMGSPALLTILLRPDSERPPRSASLEGTAEPVGRRTVDRLRGGSDAPGCAVGMLQETERWGR
jgi:hypothetical protein